ncbi:cytochrome P460 [Planomicrobium soli]|uniref:Cytochrome P460 n=1 Tax=Planomicrobium soli TaxID=1176648 RepID=A0A2P8H4D9_9BACL|nr:cytochrome P460 family protein [Planomicrobium soli]PSL41063.1 cytochrome P460 [Planomicrobium soli]
MKRILRLLGILFALTLTACSEDNESADSALQNGEETSGQGQEFDEIGSGAHLVEFPEDLEEGIVFATYDRGDIHEDIYINSEEAIEAAQNGEEFPRGTVITLVGYKDGELDQYLVMEKQEGWGSQYSPEERNGEWEYQRFTPDREVAKDNIGRCFTCHANQERDDYINSMDQLEEFDLEDVAQSKEKSGEIFGSVVPTEQWKVSEGFAHTNGINRGETRLLEAEEKSKKIQEVLLRLYIQQFKS